MNFLKKSIKEASLEVAATLAAVGVFLKKYIFLRGSPSEKRLLIVKLDHIGDYVLFRNFLEEIRASEQYRDYHIVFCGNETVRSLAEWLDRDVVDEFIWINKKRIFRNPFYWCEILIQMYGRFTVAIQPTYSRELAGDLLIRFSGAAERVGCDGDCNCLSKKDKNKTNRWYTRLISIKSEYVFEFFKNKDFFEQLFNAPIKITKPTIDPRRAIESVPVMLLPLIKKDFVVFFPGASLAIRRWPAIKFAALGDYVAEKYGYQIVILGGPFDKPLSDIVVDNSFQKNILDLTGKTELPQLVGIFAKAKLIISNDTSAAHFGAALGVPTVVLSQFNLYGRFVPYPPNITDGKMVCVTPKEYSDLNREDLIEKFAGGSMESMDLITIDQVKNAVDTMLHAQTLS